MKYIAAYLLAKLGGKDEPSVDDMKSIIESVGIEFDSEKANTIINKLKGKDLDEVINEGASKLSVVSNNQETHQEQQTSNENKVEANKKNEEEETLELGLGDDFDDLFN